MVGKGQGGSWYGRGEGWSWCADGMMVSTAGMPLEPEGEMGRRWGHLVGVGG